MPPCLLQLGRRWAPFLFLIYRMGARKPESKVLISDCIVRDFTAQALLPAFCEPLSQSLSVPLLYATAAGIPAPKGAREWGKAQGLRAPWCLPSGRGEKDLALLLCWHHTFPTSHAPRCQLVSPYRSPVHNIGGKGAAMGAGWAGLSHRVPALGTWRSTDGHL